MPCATLGEMCVKNNKRYLHDSDQLQHQSRVNCRNNRAVISDWWSVYSLEASVSVKKVSLDLNREILKIQNSLFVICFFRKP